MRMKAALPEKKLDLDITPGEIRMITIWKIRPLLCKLLFSFTRM